MTEPQTGSIGGEREAGREARVFGNVAKRAVESYLTLSLMIIDSSITERGEGPWLAGSHHSTESHDRYFGLAFAHRHTHTNPLQVPLFAGCMQNPRRRSVYLNQRANSPEMRMVQHKYRASGA